MNQQPTIVDVVRYRSTTARCPACRRWYAELVIDAAGDLHCRNCPALTRRRGVSSGRKRKVAA